MTLFTHSGAHSQNVLTIQDILNAKLYCKATGSILTLTENVYFCLMMI